MEKRSPIIAVMGHVDHGKTTLLDCIRKTSVVMREAGGITQSIGAYEIVYTPAGADKNVARKITFLDTPGHEAFAVMRSESVKVADVVILVVAADDGVKPQTLNTLEYLKREKTPFIVAINKIDKQNANVEKTKTDLANAGVYLEGFGGSVSWHQISAKTGDGVPELLDITLLTSDILGLSCDSQADAEGIVLTSKVDGKQGNIVGVVVKNGTLKEGTAISTNTAAGKIRRIIDSTGHQVKELIPSAPALILGFGAPPLVGEEFKTGKSSDSAVRSCLVKTETAAGNERDKKMPLIIKANEAGSLEALKNVITKLCEKFPLCVISKGIGDIYENEAKLALQTGGIILGFNVKIDKAALNVIRAHGITAISSDIIYELEKSIEEFFSGNIKHDFRKIKILATFGGPGGKEYIIGGKVIKAPVRNQEPFELWRNIKPIGKGKIINLQSGRKDVSEAGESMEVGLLVSSDMPMREDDELMFEDK